MPCPIAHLSRTRAVFSEHLYRVGNGHRRWLIDAQSGDAGNDHVLGRMFHRHDGGKPIQRRFEDGPAGGVEVRGKADGIDPCVDGTNVGHETDKLDLVLQSVFSNIGLEFSTHIARKVQLPQQPTTQPGQLVHIGADHQHANVNAAVTEKAGSCKQLVDPL